jgi:hypothetical protein
MVMSFCVTVVITDCVAEDELSIALKRWDVTAIRSWSGKEFGKSKNSSES